MTVSLRMRQRPQEPQSVVTGTAIGAELRTSRLLLRVLTTRDAEVLAEFAGDWDVARMTARIAHPYSVTEAFHWIASIREQEFVRAIVHEGGIVGIVAFSRDAQEAGQAELGYWLGKSYWGHGFATEAAHEVCRYCFEVAGLVRLTCSHFVDNAGSGNVATKLGFRRTGRHKVWCQARLGEVEAISYDLVPRRLKRLKKR